MDEYGIFSKHPPGYRPPESEAEKPRRGRKPKPKQEVVAAEQEEQRIEVAGEMIPPGREPKAILDGLASHSGQFIMIDEMAPPIFSRSYIETLTEFLKLLSQPQRDRYVNFLLTEHFENTAP
ncbi:MAG: hypothetical protein LUF04_16295 [Bacteroides sp.]|nr:hypothetical protein [Bacteroides sp.]